MYRTPEEVTDAALHGITFGEMVRMGGSGGTPPPPPPPPPPPSPPDVGGGRRPGKR